MQFDGRIEAPVSCQSFYSFVTDPKSVLSVIPDVIDSRIVDDDHFSVRARVGAGPIKGIIDMDFEVLDMKRPKFARLRGLGRGMQSSIDLSLSMSIEKTKTGCEARWNAEVNVGGMLAGVGGRMLAGITERYVRQMTDQLSRKVAE